MSSTKRSCHDVSDQPPLKRHFPLGQDLSAPSSPVQELLQQAAGFACTLTDQQFARCMDRIDPLRHLREEFEIPRMNTIPTVDESVVNMEDDGIYMCGNSLGLMPRSIRGIVSQELDKWANMGVLGHFSGSMPWAMSDELLVGKMAKLVGANEDEVAIMNGLSVNIHMLLVSFYRPTKERHKILIEDHAFPSDHYIAESQIDLHGFNPQTSLLTAKAREGEHCLQMADLMDLIEREGDSIAVIMLPGIQYYTGQVFDMKAITEAGHKKGCVVGFDLAHAVGNIEMHLHDWNVDFAAWCTYKYLNSGAGASAGAFLHDRHSRNNHPRLTGWWGHQMTTRFHMDNKMHLAPGIAGYRVTNPSFMANIPVKASLEIFAKTSLSALRKKSLLLTGYLEYLVRLYFSRPQSQSQNESIGKTESDAATGVYIDIITPSDPAERGCQLSLMFNTTIDDVLTQLFKRGVLCDERKPNVIRIAPTPLYTKFEDVWRMIQALRDSLDAVKQQKCGRSLDELD
ncbi:kynureninase-like [Acanthaster planci]|uniref:Kynureninase n=1 Tax=Acanthaster planci TaxID=133434 RepID=A0A8B7ZD64_ACAPL|nr:kynureninase-like [Acanthaster planci]XP_022103617.1 kynureninase-like [Acanthaster planci]XP_022103618.1 kynureninase-like [Acanthaster planci]